MTLVVSFNSVADIWAFWIGHVAWQATIVAVLLLLIIRLGDRWPAPVRHGLLLLVLLKFVIPPVTNLPVGVFSLWSVDQSHQRLAPTETVSGGMQTLEEASAGNRVSAANTPVEREDLSKHYKDLQIQKAPGSSLESRGDTSVTMADMIKSVPFSPGDDTVSANVTQRAEPQVAGIIANENASRSLTALLMLTHIIGSIVFVVCLLWRVRTLRASIDAMPLAPGNCQELFRSLASRIGLRRSIEFRISTEDCSPYSFGILRPVVVVSECQLIELSHEQLRDVLLHELVHHYRRDLAVCRWQAVVTSVWWFHPAVWIVNRRIQALREDCCDDFLLSRQCVEPAAYCATLLNVAKGDTLRRTIHPALTVSMAQGHHPLSDRFRRIMDSRQPRGTRLSVAGVIGLLLTTIVLIPGMNSTGSPIAQGEDVPVATAATPAVPVADKPVKKLAIWPERIRVSVVDPNGQPIAGATVQHKVDRITTEHATDASGEVTIAMPEDTSAVEFMSLIVDTAPYVVFGKYWSPQRSPERPIDVAYEFRLEAGLTIGGRVVDAADQPIVGADVRVTASPNNGTRPAPRPTSHTFIAKTDEQGRWIQDRIPLVLESIALQVRHPDFSSDPLETGIPVESWVELFEQKHLRVMKTGTSLTGRVTDIDGNPIEGVQLRMGADWYGNSGDVPVTDAQGRFRFLPCEQGTQPVTAWKPGYAPELQNVSLDKNPRHIEFTMPRGNTLAIQVIDPEGQPIPNANVRPEYWREARSLYWVSEHFGYDYPKTNLDGMWVWNWAPADEIAYSVYCPGWRRAARTKLTADKEILQITMRPARTVNVSVVDAVSVNPVQDFEYIPGSGLSMQQYLKKRITDGKFTYVFDDAESDDRLRIEARGYVAVVQKIDDSLGDNVELTIKLQPVEKRLFAVVTDKEGKPEANARLIVATRDNRVYVRANLQADLNGGLTLTTDAEGRTELPVWPEDFMIFAISKTGFAQKFLADNEPRSGDVTIQTTPTAHIEGTLKKNGKPLVNEQVSLDFDDDQPGSFGHFDFDATTDNQGHFVFEQVPADNDIRVSHTLVERNGQFLTQRPDATARLRTRAGTTVSLALGRHGKYSVRGKFAYDDGNGTRVAWEKFHANLTASEPLGENLEELVQYVPAGNINLNEDGSFEIAGLDPDRYQIFFSPWIGTGDEAAKKGLTGSTRQTFDVPSDNENTVIDLGTLTVYPDGQQQKRDALPVKLPSVLEIINKTLPSPESVELKCVIQDSTGKMIPAAEVTLWYGSEGPAQRITKTSDAAGVATFKNVPNHGGWLFVEAKGFRFHGQIVEPEMIASSTEIQVTVTRASEPAMTLKKVAESASSETVPAAEAAMIQFAERVLAGKVQRDRFELERLLSRFSPDLAIKIHRSNTIDFGGMTDNPQSFAQWHDTVFYGFAAQTLARSNIPAAEVAINSVDNAPSRSWVYSSTARSLPLSERTQAIKWLDIAYSLAREPGEEFIPLSEQLADIAAGYRKYSADAAVLKILQEAAVETAEQTDKERFEYSKRQVAKHLAAYDFPAALKLIGFDLSSDPPEQLNVSEFTAQMDAANGSERDRLTKLLMSDRSRDEQLGDVAITIADIHPEAAERILAHLRTSKNNYAPKIVHRMARVDLERATRIAERIINDRYEAQAFGAIANSIADTNRDQARTLIRKAFEILAAAETPEGTLPESPLKIAVSLLPTVEKIDAEMIPEYIFRTLALRRTTTCGTKFGVPIDNLGHTGERNLLRLSDPVLAAAIARYDISIARQLAMAPGDTTLELSWDDAPTFLLGAMARIQPNAISFDAVNKTGSLTPWSQILPGLTLDQDEYWTWLMKEQFGIWEIGMDE